MRGIGSYTKKIRFYSNITGLYLLTLLVGWFIFQPTSLINNASALTLPPAAQQPHIPISHRAHLVYGLPVRITIANPYANVDLPIDPGYYNPQTNGWTLSGRRAQFAMVSTLANNVSGNTFIYGHNNDYVFGALRHDTPTPGSLAYLYTSNNHVFAYRFESATSLAPNDVSALDYSGPPVMTIQTCTGSLNEYRTMYRYTFYKVVQ